MDNVTILKYTVLIGLMPIWWPFIKTVWNDLKEALREDGGLFGAPPHPRKLEEIRRQKAREQSHLVHEPRVRQGQRASFGKRQAKGGGAAQGGRSGTGGSVRNVGGAANAPRRGFR